MRTRSLLALLLAGLLSPCAGAAVPQRLNYQGKLANAAGDPLTGTYSFRFKLFAAETGGAALFSEDVTGGNAVSVVNGIYTVQIGSYTPGGVPYGVFDGPDLYLEVDVATGSSLAGAETLSPRERLNAAAWAVHALGAERLGTGAVIATFTATGALELPAGSTIAANGTFTLSTAASAALTGTPALFIDRAGNVGVGTSSPAKPLVVSATGDAASANAQARVTDPGNGVTLHLGADAAGNVAFIQGDLPGTGARNLVLQRNGASVGVGTTNPTAKLDLVDTGTPNDLATVQSLPSGANAGYRYAFRAGLEGLTGNNAVAYGGRMNASNLANQYLLYGYRSDNGVMTAGIRGSGAAYFGGDVGVGTTGPASRLDVQVDDAVNDSTVTVLSIGHTTSGAPAAGIGARINFRAERSDGNMATPAFITALFTDVTAGSEDGDLVFGTMQNSAGAGTEKMRVTSAGNVGIGTATPQAPGHIKGSATGGETLRLEAVSVANEGGQMTLMDYDGTGGWELDNWGTPGSESLRIFRDKGDNVTAVVVSTAGYVGLGNSSPGAKLDVAGNLLFSVANASITFNAGGPTIGIPAGNTLAFGTSGSERARIDNVGNVGIGTSAPASRLQVVGDYIQVPTITGSAPNATDCDAANEGGRLVVKTDGTAGQRLWVCLGTGGWVSF